MDKSNGKPKAIPGITRIAVRGFKSLAECSEIEIRPLTILAGANSSGKSSIMQPLLMMKQTLDAPYDPGAIELDGGHVHFTSMSQLLSRVNNGSNPTSFEFKIDFGPVYYFHTEIGSLSDNKIAILSQSTQLNGKPIKLWADMMEKEVDALKSALILSDPRVISSDLEEDCAWSLYEERGFLALDLYLVPSGLEIKINQSSLLREPIGKTIHLPGYRDAPSRFYRRTRVYPKIYAGTFDTYAASIIYDWQENNKSELDSLIEAMKSLRLASFVQAELINDSQIEIKVARLFDNTEHNHTQDLVNIADVGFGVSQSLPVLVALFIADPEQLVYLEEPEIHLHPRAQAALAQILVDAIHRGVRVVVETHSSLLLLAIQTLVAEGKLSADKAILHWFERNEDGITKITSSELDEAGAYGEWPEDFGDIESQTQMRYIEAASERMGF